MMEWLVLIIFCFVYIGMFLGEIPGLALDRAGIALLGAIGVTLCGALSPEEAWEAIDVPTIALLFGLMVVSSQFRLGGFYTALTKYIATLPLSAPYLLGVLITASGFLSAILANDIVCLAMTPILIDGCVQRRMNPIPFCLGLACASNIGSAATLIGNPQNMLIGQKLQMSFSGYLLDSAIPSILGLLACWGILAWLYRGRWTVSLQIPHPSEQPFNAWQSSKGIAVTLVLMVIFLFTPLPREAAALAAGGILLLSRKMASRQMLGLVDWQILVLFFGLFVVNRAVENTGRLTDWVEQMEGVGLSLHHPASLFIATAALSNLVSNVPAVMLLLPVATHPIAGAVLALSSTLAGNLILVGSIANIIVVDKAEELGIEIGWREHAKAGIPVTFATLGLSAIWLWYRHGAM